MSEDRELFIQHRAEGVAQIADSFRVSIRCPRCGRQGTFDVYGSIQHDLSIGSFLMGHRRCPARDCNVHVFFIAEHDKVIACYPPQTIDFDREGAPEPVREAIEEAIIADAHRCYRAAALMVRRAVEEICLEREASGETLYDRIEALAGKVILPKAFLEGLHDVRLLGNDAAHVEARVYEEIGRQEVEAGIAIAKELIRAVYQYEGIMGQLGVLKGASGPDGAA